MGKATTVRNPTETKALLLRVAARQFNTVGYREAGTNRIAADAGFAPQTFYRHFPDKRLIFLGVYREWSATLQTRIGEAVTRKRTLRSRISAMVKAMVAHHREWAVFRASLIELDATDEVVRNTRRKERAQHLVRIRELLNVGEASGLLFMWSCERAADGIGSGEGRAFGLADSALVDELTAMLLAMLEGRRPNET